MKWNILRNCYQGIKRFYIIYNFIFFLKNRKFIKLEYQVLNTLHDLEEYSENDIYILQKNELFRILRYAYENTDYYARLFDQHGIKITRESIDTVLKDIPLLTKGIIKEFSKELLSKEYSEEELMKRKTSGSTGTPLKFFADPAAPFKDNAHHWYLYDLMGYQKGDIIMSSGGIKLDDSLLKKNIYWIERPIKSALGKYIFSALYINSENVHYYVEKMLLIRPMILRGYPSFFDKIARYILSNNINIDFNIKGINLTSEICTVEQKERIEKAFNTMIYFEYGHTEICLFCYTHTKEYIYQSSPIYGYIEVLDEQQNDVQIGEVGNIVVTGFNNQGMPFIRYVTGDLGKVIYRNGGHVYFEKIYGRLQDYIITAEHKKELLISLVLSHRLKALEHIIQWQFIQNKEGEITIKIIKDKDYTVFDEQEIRNHLNKYIKIKIFFEYVDTIPTSSIGKQLFLIQNIKS